jgi:23S rRNA pseudouridine1911/1915/1917 synthase
VHRLDKDTTGLMVVAKTDQRHQALAAQFADHGRTGPLRRGYLAFVWGAPARPKGTIDEPIDRHPKSRDRMAVRRTAATPSPIGRCWSAFTARTANRWRA